MQVTSSKCGHLLSKFMHDEDNKYGLRVTNYRGEKWIAYGDGMLLNEESEDNYRIAVDAVQTSVDHVYEAFLFPKKATNSKRVTDYIPFVDESKRNNSPLFKAKDGIVLCRADLENLSDSTATTNWSGVGTAITLRSYKPRNSVIKDNDDDVDDDDDDEEEDDIDCRSCGQSLHPELPQ